MEKHATLDGVAHDGKYANPVSVLFGDEIEYKITAVNANLQAGKVIITDTLPAYLEYVSGSASTNGFGTIAMTSDAPPPREVLTWTLNSVQPLTSHTVSFEATPVKGAVASQPMFINKAWVQTSDTILSQTNGTYHQGAGVSVVTFSAAAGGAIFNADRQALDYRTSPRGGVLIVPDSGYVFAGWQHDAYYSLRGELIPADSGVMRLDSLVVYGNVDLRASFAPDSAAADPEDDALAATAETGDKVWAHAGTLYVRTAKGVTVRVYTADGLLRRSFVTTTAGLTTRPLFEPGIYIVTLNGNAGWKVAASD
jgi:uncharacterized repeat protein (TIGR01451 family)